MRSVRAEARYPGTVPEAERCWCETERWPAWVDGCRHVLSVDASWPESGAAVVWESGPAGRGRVHERVVEREPLHGLTLEVEDPSIRARQSVTFTPAAPGVAVALSLEYELVRRTPVSWLVDLLFIRRVMTSSLQSTVHRFGVELASSRRRHGSAPDQ
jgi:hypothetical protein